MLHFSQRAIKKQENDFQPNFYAMVSQSLVFSCFPIIGGFVAATTPVVQISNTI